MVSKAGEEIAGPPGRDLLMSEAQTFADLAAAIDGAFARWDRSHLHEFHLADGRRVVMPSGEDEETDAADEIPEAQQIGSVGLRAGSSFKYVFDLGDDWQHGCTVLRTDVDPLEEWGSVPTEIVPIFGWGTIPDQYGRLEPGQDALDECNVVTHVIRDDDPALPASRSQDDLFILTLELRNDELDRSVQRTGGSNGLLSR